MPIPTSREKTDPGIVSDADIMKMVEMQGLSPIGEGDCVFLYTGHGDLWHPRDWDTFSAEEKRKRISEFNAGEPGFGLSGCDYLAERKIILWGSDTFPRKRSDPVSGANTINPSSATSR